MYTFPSEVNITRHNKVPSARPLSFSRIIILISPCRPWKQHKYLLHFLHKKSRHGQSVVRKRKKRNMEKDRFLFSPICFFVFFCLVFCGLDSEGVGSFEPAFSNWVVTSIRVESDMGDWGRQLSNESIATP